MSNPGVRTARLADLESLLQIEHAAGIRFDQLRGRAGFAELVVPSDLSPRTELERAITEQLCWVAELDRDPAGFLYATALGSFLFVEELSVAPHAGRRGLGRSLLREVEAEAGRRNCEGVALTTYREVPWNAPWYLREGYLEPATTPKSLARVLTGEAARGFVLDQRVLLMKSTLERTS